MTRQLISAPGEPLFHAPHAKRPPHPNTGFVETVASREMDRNLYFECGQPSCPARFACHGSPLTKATIARQTSTFCFALPSRLEPYSMCVEKRTIIAARAGTKRYIASSRSRRRIRHLVDSQSKCHCKGGNLPSLDEKKGLPIPKE